MKTAPRVSIGMPVFNGMDGICRALDSLLAQTYQDFELIISDNASTDRTADICQQYATRDARIRYVRQQRNIGAFANFDYVLRIAQGEYFMWAAHDDKWDPRFIENALSVFDVHDEAVVAVAAEAQYTINNIAQDFFPEGSAFRKLLIENPAQRVAFMLDHNFGDLFYSLYRRKALLTGENTALSVAPSRSMNEIPFFLQVAARGNWLVSEYPLIFKDTNIRTYLNARWEINGGCLESAPALLHHLRSIVYAGKYHVSAIRSTLASIGLLSLPNKDKRKLKLHAVRNFAMHFIYFAIRWKPKRKVVTDSL